VEKRFFPLDRALGLLGGAYTPQVQEAITRLSSRMSYREAHEELSLLWKVKVSKGSMQQVTMRYGRVADALVEEEVAYLETTAPVPTAQPGQMVVCTDGAMVQLTSGEWRETKTVTFGEFQTVWKPKKRKIVTQTNQISYFSRMEPAEGFTRSALVEWQRRGGANAHTVVAVQDGAQWIQSFVDYHCPQATRVLDFAHAQGYVATVGRAIYGAETDAFRQWYGQTSKELGRQPPQRTIRQLRLLQRQHPDHPEAETIELAIRYLEKREAMIDYPRFRRQQIPIGSGNVESAHKVVMHQRMKQAGMRWAEKNINPMLTLRVALCNETWQATWQKIEAQVRRERYPTRIASKRVVSQPSEPTVVTEADCRRLTALTNRMGGKREHPWRDSRWLFPKKTLSIHRI
jgi:hypothetical protein